MRISTIGSKVLDDVIKYSRGIENTNRITNISPFCFSYNTGIEELESLLSTEPDSYARKMTSAELTGCVLKNSSDIYVLDLLDCRLNFLQIELHNKIFRISHTNFTEDLIKKIKEIYGENAQVKEFNPIKLSRHELRDELARYVQWIRSSIPDKRVLLVEHYHVTNYVSKGTLCALPSDNPLCKNNNFYIYINSIFKELYSCTCVPFLNGMYLNSFTSAASFWNYPEEYYHYLADSYKSFLDGNNYFGLLQDNYEKQIIYKAEKIYYFATIKQIERIRNNRRIIVCADTMDLAHKIIEVLHIDNISDILLIERLESISNDDYEKNIILFLPSKDLREKMLLLWNKGWTPGEDYICLSHERIILRNFKGNYYDLFGNKMIIKSNMDIELDGICNEIDVREDNDMGSLCLIQAKNANHIYVGMNVFNYMYNKFCNKTKIRSDNGCEVLIGDNCVIREGTIIAGNDFCDISIEKNALLAADVLVNNNLCELWKWKKSREAFRKTSIFIGKNVKIGFRSIIRSDSTVEENTIIEPKSVI